MKVSTKSILGGGVVIAILLSLPVQARLKTGQEKLPYQPPQSAAPLQQLRVHKIGNIWLSITNYGQIGNAGQQYKDVCTGMKAPSFQFPAGSGIDYLFIGALWVGAIVNDTDTLVSVGHEGWQNVGELHPSENGAIISRTIRSEGYQQGDCFTTYSDSANSELDYIAVYFDTNTNVEFTPPDDFDGPRADEVLAMVDLTDKAGEVVRNYSGGMKRRLEIARGLLHHPRVLFLDEPTLGLDPQTRTHIWDYVLELRRQ